MAQTAKSRPARDDATTSPDMQELLPRLRALLPELRERYSVDTLEVFGSRARGNASASSDLDLLVTFRRMPGFLGLVALENEISDTLGVPVDLVIRRSLKPRLRDRILREAVAVR